MIRQFLHAKQRAICHYGKLLEILILFDYALNKLYVSRTENPLKQLHWKNVHMQNFTDLQVESSFYLFFIYFIYAVIDEDEDDNR